MGIAYFRRHSIIDIEGTQYRMKREIADGEWQIENVLTGLLKIYAIDTLLRLYAERKLMFPAVDTLLRSDGDKASRAIVIRPEPSGALWNDAKTRRAYVKAVELLPATRRLLEIEIRRTWETLKQPAVMPHWTTVQRWRTKFLAAGGDMHALVEARHRKGNHSPRFSPELLSIVDEVVEHEYLTKERKSVNDVLAAAICAVKRANESLLVSDRLPQPSRRLIHARIDRLPAFDKHVARYGYAAAIRQFRAKLRHEVTEHRLEVAEIDHTQLDLMVISDVDGLPLGRPWVTACIDRRTRCILGVHLGFQPPSYLSVSRCLSHAFKPKTALQEQFPNIRHPWEAFGVMKKLVVDNGMEFHGTALEAACAAFDVDIVYTPRKSPWYKGKIERFFRRMNEELAHGRPGTTFSNIFEKGEYDPAKHAVISLSTIRAQLHHWICDVYHQTPHYGLEHVSPAKMWASSSSIPDTPVADDLGKIDVLLGKPATVRLDHRGIRLHLLAYNSSEIVSLRKQYGDDMRVEIRSDEENLGRIYVKHPEDDVFIAVPCIDLAYADGLSLWQHNLIRRHARERRGRDDLAQWAESKMEIAAMGRGKTIARSLKRHRGRLEDRRRTSASSSQPESSAPRPRIAIAQDAPEPVAGMGDAAMPEFIPIIRPRGTSSTNEDATQ